MGDDYILGQGQPLRLNIGEEIQKQLEERVRYLQENHRPLSELVVEEAFDVLGVVSQSYKTDFTPHSEVVIGRTSPIYRTGHRTGLILDVKPKNSSIPVNQLLFEGSSIVKAGDYILAKILKSKKEELDFSFEIGGRRSVFYLPRDFKEQEEAIELSILSLGKELLRIDRSIRYNNVYKN